MELTQVFPKISLNGEFLWNKSFGNPKGGDLIFSGLDEGDPRLSMMSAGALLNSKMV